MDKWTTQGLFKCTQHVGLSFSGHFEENLPLSILHHTVQNRSKSVHLRTAKPLKRLLRRVQIRTSSAFWIKWIGSRGNFDALDRFLKSKKQSEHVRGAKIWRQNRQNSNSNLEVV